MSSVFPDFIHCQVELIDPIVVGDGCFRRDLPARNGVRVWVVDMAPGAMWPTVDDHNKYGEDIFVVSGELIEGERRLGAGSYLAFSPNSSHRPHTETGVRLFGFNLRPRS